MFIKQAFYTDDDISGLVVMYFQSSLWVTTNVISLYLVIVKVGMIYVDAAVLREGKDETLDNLKEGVLILNESDLEILFYNKAAVVQSEIYQGSSGLFDVNVKPNTKNFMK